MNQPTPGQCQMPLPLPFEQTQRIVLRCLRRMAAHGIRDAQASLWVFEQFGIHYRRPLVLLRAFVVELAQVSQRRIQIAPCCAMRMTLDEGRIVEILAVAGQHQARAQRHLRLLTDTNNASSPLSLAVAFNDTLAALGKPLVL
jgi:hypothetical protein